MSMRETLERLQVENPVLLYLGLGGATVALLAAATIGATRTRGTQINTNQPGVAVAPGSEGGTVGEGEPVIDPETGEVKSAGSGLTSSSKGSSKTGSSSSTSTEGGTAPRTGTAAKDLVSETGQTRVGVTKTEIRWGLHAPKTFGNPPNNLPLPLADATLKGVREIYVPHINQSKVNGRIVKEFFSDDNYTVEGGGRSRDKIFGDDKVFFASGTLGVDQVATVAEGASRTQPTPTPYMAAGGSEKAFKNIGMFQIAGSYDTHLTKLAQFLSKEVAKPPCNPGTCTAVQSIYGGKPRVAAVELDSPYIQDSVEELRKAIVATGNLQWVGKVTVLKYTDSSNTHVYSDKCIRLVNEYKAEIVIPAVDPLTTANMSVTKECAAARWTMSNFAHDLDTALKIMQGTWIQVRGLSAGCYYTNYETHSEVSKCGQLKKAHDIWISINSEDDWKGSGQGGIAGYQITHFWLKALKEAGSDLTRERFLAALRKYDGYNDLVTSPITFLNSPNISHGVEKFAVYESVQPQGVWKMISDGLLSSF